MNRPSVGFRRLALATGIATFALIVLGGVVRVSDSGLGCGPAGSGFNGWPFCDGAVVPGLDLNSVIEYAHRALASAVGIMIIALAVLAIRQKALVRWTIVAVVLVIAQGILGRVHGRGEPSRGSGGSAPRARNGAAGAAHVPVARES